MASSGRRTALLPWLRLLLPFPVPFCMQRIKILAIEGLIIPFDAASTAAESRLEGVEGSHGDDHAIPPVLALVGRSSRKKSRSLCVQIPLILQKKFFEAIHNFILSPIEFV